MWFKLVKINRWVVPSYHVAHDMYVMSAWCVAHDCALATQACVGDSSWCNEEIEKDFELCLSMQSLSLVVVIQSCQDPLPGDFCIINSASVKNLKSKPGQTSFVDDGMQVFPRVAGHSSRYAQQLSCRQGGRYWRQLST